MGLLQGCKEDINENLVLMRGCVKEEYGSKFMWLLAALTSLQAGRMAESLSLLLAFSRRLLFQITCFKRKGEKSISLSILLKQLERCFWLEKKKKDSGAAEAGVRGLWVQGSSMDYRLCCLKGEIRDE